MQLTLEMFGMRIGFTVERVGPDQRLFDQVREEKWNHGRLAAMRKYRTLTGAGVGEARAFVEAIPDGPAR